MRLFYGYAVVKRRGKLESIKGIEFGEQLCERPKNNAQKHSEEENTVHEVGHEVQLVDERGKKATDRDDIHIREVAQQVPHALIGKAVVVVGCGVNSVKKWHEKIKSAAFFQDAVCFSDDSPWLCDMLKQGF